MRQGDCYNSWLGRAVGTILGELFCLGGWLMDLYYRRRARP